ncbi:heavy-metal-associated domain-containing protein [Methyloglobulus sp.]|uniref:heavy-metal-associated domain-containing protein n=1 Tax=Methyloglobulus sp. TaxID=2518622 RepID=UPI003988D9F4
MWIKKLKIDGMTCSSCADGIEKELNALEGVEIKVSYPEGIGILTVTGETRLASLLEQITQKGYHVKEIDGKTAETDECLVLPRCC